MADVFSSEKRSQIMQKVKSKHNKTTELKLIKFFKVNNIKGWRRHFPLPGTPDFTFPKFKIVIFADGCFWHGHHCRNISPKQNKEYWVKKQNRNIQRDEENTQLLINKGWAVIRIWECEITDEKKIEQKLQLLLAFLNRDI